MPAPKLPVAVAFLLRHAAIGFGLATLLILALFWANPGGVAEVLRRAPGHPWPTLLLWFFCGLTLGAVQIGIAVMLEDRPPDDDERGGGRRDPLPVPMAATRRG
jgi:fatty acid desaturase